MSDAAPPASRAPLRTPSLRRVWPDPGRPAAPGALAAALGLGLLAAAMLPGHRVGAGALVVLLVLMGVAGRMARARAGLFPVAGGALCLALGAVLVLRDAGWVVALCVLAALAVGVVTLSGARTVPGLLASALAVPVACVRGWPWVRRGIAAVTAGRRAAVWPVARTTLLTSVLMLAFGSLFASADAVFAQWTDLLLPDPSLGLLGRRLVTFSVVAALTLALAYVATVRPRLDRLARPSGVPVRHFEWAVPVLTVDVVFAVFLGAQVSTLFGGDAYVQRTTGLTYAEYVHQGFGQLVAATVLTLVVVTTAARRAGRRREFDRALLRVLLGLLCVLTLVVVGSALYRLYVYEQAYGFTRLRLLVAAFEVWLGALLVLLLLAGIRLRGRWLPRSGLFTGAVVILALALLNPDAYIAQRNVERFERTGRIDWVYLRWLSADSVPVLDRLPEPYRSCALNGIAPVPEDDLLGWNLGRARAHAVLRARPPGPDAACRTLPAG